MNDIISAVLVVGGLGLIFGCVLAFAYSIFYVPQDERVDRISEILPGANCGGCGYAGCSAFASAVVSGEAPVNACIVGKTAVAQSIANIMGVEAKNSDTLVAHVLCAGDCNSALYKYSYMGVPDCESAIRLSGGAKECNFGCLGLGSCTKVCKFDAVKVENGVAAIDESKCTGCGACVRKCPKQIISLVPLKSEVFVKCSNTDKGAAANKECKNSCIGCKICEKNCPNQAIKVENNLAVIDHSICTSCGLCVEKCPKGVIHFEKNA